MQSNQIQQLIAQARLPEALAALKEYLPTHLQNEVLQLQSRLQELQRKERLGIIDNANANLERNKITAAALDLYSNPDRAAAPEEHTTGKTIIQNAEKIYNIDKIDKADFS